MGKEVEVVTMYIYHDYDGYWVMDYMTGEDVAGPYDTQSEALRMYPDAEPCE
jgi:hypothetical protein